MKKPIFNIPPPELQVAFSEFLASLKVRGLLSPRAEKDNSNAAALIVATNIGRTAAIAGVQEKQLARIVKLAMIRRESLFLSRLAPGFTMVISFQDPSA